MGEGNLYSNLAGVCTRFYDLSIDESRVAGFVESKIGKFKPKKLLFIGGFFLVAKKLLDAGYDLTVADYTNEMVEEGKKRLPGVNVVKADVRDLPFSEEFDAVLVIGRVFTHMHSNESAVLALQSIKKTLKPNGILLFDNYEGTKIMGANYFNGKITVKDNGIEIIRDSTTSPVSRKPFLINWKARYTVKENGKVQEFNDEMLHRAFSRQEIKGLVENNGFRHLEDGDNFDETSFYVIAKKPNNAEETFK